MVGRVTSGASGGERTGRRRSSRPYDPGRTRTGWLAALSGLIVTGALVGGCSTPTSAPPRSAQQLDITSGRCPAAVPANRPLGAAADIYLAGRPGGPVVAGNPSDAVTCFYRISQGPHATSVLLGTLMMTPRTAAALASYIENLPQPASGSINCPTASGIWVALFVFSYPHSPASGVEYGSCGTVGSTTGLRTTIGQPNPHLPAAVFMSDIDAAYLVGRPKATNERMANALNQFSTSLDARHQ